MGGPVLPIGANIRCGSDDDLIGTMRNLTTDVQPTNGLQSVAVDFLKGNAKSLVKMLGDIFSLSGPPDSDDGNRTDPDSNKFPPSRDWVDHPKFGGGLKCPGVSLRLNAVKILPDFDGLKLVGDAKATLMIGTEYPAYDSPTDIDLKLSSTTVTPTQIGLVGSASLYKVFRGDFKLQLHYDSRTLIERLVRFAAGQDLTRSHVEQMLQNISFDASAVMRLGGLWLSTIKLGASSILPLRRPLIGATEEVLPVQLSALPDRQLLIEGWQVLPKGALFSTESLGFGLHYSRYGRAHGFRTTIAGLALPDPSNLTRPQVYGFAEARYATRVSDSLDIDIGFTYAYSLSGDATTQDSAIVQYQHAASKPWLPPSEENNLPDPNLSGHNLMFTIRGEFDLLSGNTTRSKSH